MAARLRPHLVLRQRRRPLRRGAREAARDGRSCGRSSAASATACTDAKQLRFRYGVQVNSLGLTEAQPENNVQRIVLEALAVTLGRDARARALQLPAWNEALGLPRPWDQQWSLRIQQVLAYETDLLEYPDIFEGSTVMDGLVAELLEGARAEMARRGRARRRRRGGRLHEGRAGRVAPRARSRRIESRRAGRGRRRTATPRPSRSPLTGRRRRRHPGRRPGVEADADRRAGARGAPQRDAAAVDAALDELRRGGRATEREHHGRHDRRRARRARPPASGRARCATCSAATARRPASARRPRRAADERLAELRDEVARVSEELGRPLKILVGKPGLDGHSNGAEQIAVRARDAGMDVVYEGIRLTPAQIAALRGRRGRARDRALDPVRLAPRADPRRDRRAARGRRRRRPGRRRRDHPRRRRRAAAGAPAWRAVYTPKDFELTRIMRDIVELWSRRATACSRGRPVSGLARARRAAARARPRRPRPAALNLLENRAPTAREAAALLARSRPRARRRGARRTSSASPGRRAPASRRCSRALVARVARARAARSRCSPSTRPRKRSGGALLGDRARIELRPARPRRLHPLDGRRRAARRPRPRHARRRPGAGAPRSTSS